MLQACVLACLAVASMGVGLHGCVAAALGFGLVIGSAVFAAAL